MIPFFPNKIAYRAIVLYLIALTAVSLFYSRYAMQFLFIAMGIVCVAGFFLLTNSITRDWLNKPDGSFAWFLFGVALFIRVVYVIGSYYYFTDVVGTPFGFERGDAMGYHETAMWLMEEPWSTTDEYFFHTPGVPDSDAGYPIYLTAIYKLCGPNVIIPRLLKAILSAWMCVFIYRIAQRSFGENTGKIAGVMCMLMPNFIIYCGNHLKETEMIFLEVAFLERLDYLIRNRKYNLWTILLPTLLALSLFYFRTVLGAAAVFGFVTSAVFSSTPTMKKGWRRATLIGWGLLFLIFSTGSTIMNEVQTYWEGRGDNATKKRYEQTLRGNQWAQYATQTVMAPMIFVLPFATMVDVDEQYGQQEKSGGNFIRNFMGFFAILGVYEAIRRKKWRDFSLIGSFVIAYLGVVALSGFSNSERFLLPGLPGLILIWSYGIASLRKETFKFFTPWCFVVFAMEFAWAYFKLGSRGLF